jgi:lipoate-protein ligase B
MEIQDLGFRDYAEVLALMRELAAARAAGEIDDRVLFVEHPSVYTAGRGTRPEDEPDPASDVRLVRVERGGRVTWHGPGQLVIYPILDLAPRGRDLHLWLRTLERLGIEILARFSLEGHRSPAGTGIFVRDRKIASIGVAVRRWVSLHGLALNVDLDLAPFARIRPCGFDPGVMTSLARELRRGVTMDEAKEAAKEAAGEVLGEASERVD